MKVKALVSFSGLISMYTGEERDIIDKGVLKDLLSAKYIEEVKEDKPKKGVKSDENK